MLKHRLYGFPCVRLCTILCAQVVLGLASVPDATALLQPHALMSLRGSQSFHGVMVGGKAGIRQQIHGRTRIARRRNVLAGGLCMDGSEVESEQVSGGA